jgi:hypothetical protein
MIDYDIKNWNLVPKMYLDRFEKKRTFKTKFVYDLSYNCVKVYSLFKSIGINIPNGIFTMVKNGLPLDNPIWWDFVVEHEHGFVHVVRTCKQLEANYYHKNDDFNIHTFFQENLNKYNDEIETQISKFEKHIVYINHYKSYSNSIEQLSNEIAKIDLSEPKIIKGHITTKEDIDLYTKDIDIYTNNLILFHPKAKSLLLNSAFMIESFINIIIRIGAKTELLNYPDTLKKYLNYSFGDKLQNIKFYTRFFDNDIDLNSPVVKSVLELMSVRNKYVHFDEYSKINIIGEEYFDDKFPLFNLTKKSFQIDLLNKTYLNPSKKDIDKYYKDSFLFKDYIFSIMNKNYVESVKQLIQVNPLSYNTKLNIYSSIFPSAIMEFYLPVKK